MSDDMHVQIEEFSYVGVTNGDHPDVEVTARWMGPQDPAESPSWRINVPLREAAGHVEEAYRGRLSLARDDKRGEVALYCYDALPHEAAGRALAALVEYRNAEWVAAETLAAVVGGMHDEAETRIRAANEARQARQAEAWAKP